MTLQIIKTEEAKAGVHKVIFDKAEVRYTKNNDPLLALTFQLQNGNKISTTEYMPKIRETETSDKFNKRENNIVNYRWREILRIYGIQTEPITVNNQKENAALEYDLLMKQIAEMLNSLPSEAKSKDIFAEFEESKTGYLQFPNGVNIGTGRFLGEDEEVIIQNMKARYSTPATPVIPKVDNTLPF